MKVRSPCAALAVAYADCNESRKSLGILFHSPDRSSVFLVLILNWARTTSSCKQKKSVRAQHTKDDTERFSVLRYRCICRSQRARWRNWQEFYPKLGFLPGDA